MSSRRALLLLFVAVFAAECSRGADRASRMSPTAPTAMGQAGGLLNAPVAASGPLDAIFPPRSDSFEFYQQLDSKYRDQFRRPPTTSFVDTEGFVVWTQEYLRYRANGCDHATAVQRVFAQIDGNAAGFLCGPLPDGFVDFPPRNEIFEFRQLLEGKYQQMQRTLSSTFVDLEGAVIWLSEYLRYRTNACDHPTSLLNVFTQIDGGPAPKVCYVPPCKYTLSEGRLPVPGGGGTFSVTMFRRSGECDWTAKNPSSFITIVTDPPAGSFSNALTFTVAPNNGGPRTGTIEFEWPGGSQTLFVDQSGPNYNVLIELFDYNKTTSPATTCEVRLASHTCTLRATAVLPEGITEYDWKAEYTYGSQKVRTQVGGSDTFAFSEPCGDPSSSDGGTVETLTVTLKVTDQKANQATVVSGQGGQQGFAMVFFKCGV